VIPLSEDSILELDNDKAGHEATLAIIEKLANTSLRE
jgi:hypothetical protein